MYYLLIIEFNDHGESIYFGYSFIVKDEKWLEAVESEDVVKVSNDFEM